MYIVFNYSKIFGNFSSLLLMVFFPRRVQRSPFTCHPAQVVLQMFTKPRTETRGAKHTGIVNRSKLGLGASPMEFSPTVFITPINYIRN